MGTTSTNDQGTTTSRCGRRRRGSVLVEHALAFPVLLLLFFGLWEFARAEMIRQTISTAAFEAARQGIIPGSTVRQVRATARSALAAARIRATINITPITPNAQTITVTINAKMNDNSWVVPFFYRGRSIQSAFTLRREGIQ